MKQPVCFIDLDGVITDFVAGSLLAHAFTPEQIKDCLSTWPSGEFSIPKVIGLSSSKFWEKISEEVWRGLTPLPEAKELVVAIENILGENNVYFLSSPTIDPTCLSGKGGWLQEHFPNKWYRREFVFTPHKHLFAHKKAILIDDYDVNCRKFSEAGGWSVLYPQPWNSSHGLLENKTPHVVESVNAILGRRIDD